MENSLTNDGDGKEKKKGPPHVFQVKFQENPPLSVNTFTSTVMIDDGDDSGDGLMIVLQ
jgi:hypothetical protein